MWTYIIIGVSIAFVLLLCLCLAISSYSGENFFNKLKENDKIRNSVGISTMDYVVSINTRYFGGKLKITRCLEGDDHYARGIVALSERTMCSNSLASLATVSHELGHARQDASGDRLQKHWKLRRTGRICGMFFMPLVIVGVVLSLLYLFETIESISALIAGIACVGAGIFIFFFAIFLKYREVKIEREASDFGVEFLQEILSPDEVKQCKEFLDSARLTYWAGLFKTLLGWTFLTKNDKMFR